MSVRFVPGEDGESIEANIRLENGKVFLEWKFRYEGDEAGQGYYVKLRMTDREDRPVLECMQQIQEEEPLQSVLLHPCLWQGTENPYLYRLEAGLYSKEGKQTDQYVRMLSLYVLEEIPGKGLRLNGEAFCLRVVRYRLPEGIGTAEGQRQLMQDLQLILELGANGIYPETGEKRKKTEQKADGDEKAGDKRCGMEIRRFFLQECKRLGLLVWNGENPENLPLFREEGEGRIQGEDSIQGGEKITFGDRNGKKKKAEEYLVESDGTPTSFYQKYRAKWSRIPFVYIVPESIRQQENGSFSVSVYSNCKKVALYSDGILHEFQSGSEEFVFRGITARGPCLILTAEAEDAAESFSVHKTFTKSSLFHDN